MTATTIFSTICTEDRYLKIVTIEVTHKYYKGIITEMIWNENNSYQVSVLPNDEYNETVLSFSADTTIPITGLDKVDDIEVGDTITVIYKNDNVAIDLSNVQIVSINVSPENFQTYIGEVKEVRDESDNGMIKTFIISSA
ncbi:hypothetical protein [Scatolibacter rhodanostii]|uniref:hypothetical protein n=1 Tax=Scatolibacter rhodanostii TaxID=2014781 RepID=UPI000C0792E9|nr:hypothetical protein [Scatolibacter rhodanostii]